MSNATPRPWPQAEYGNDTGPNDEGFWEFWEIPGVARFGNEADANLAYTAVNERDAILRALEEIRSFKELPYHPHQTILEMKKISGAALASLSPGGAQK